MRTAGYKYIRNFETRRKIILSSDLKVSSASAEMWPWANEPRDAEELYDLRADPAEMRNLAASPGMEDVKAELSAHLRDWMQSTDDPLLRGPIPAPPGARVSPIDWPVK